MVEEKKPINKIYSLLEKTSLNPIDANCEPIIDEKIKWVEEVKDYWDEGWVMYFDKDNIHGECDYRLSAQDRKFLVMRIKDRENEEEISKAEKEILWIFEYLEKYDLSLENYGKFVLYFLKYVYEKTIKDNTKIPYNIYFEPTIFMENFFMHIPIRFSKEVQKSVYEKINAIQILNEKLIQIMEDFIRRIIPVRSIFDGISDVFYNDSVDIFWVLNAIFWLIVIYSEQQDVYFNKLSEFLQEFLKPTEEKTKEHNRYLKNKFLHALLNEVDGCILTYTAFPNEELLKEINEVE